MQAAAACKWALARGGSHWSASTVSSSFEEKAVLENQLLLPPQLTAYRMCVSVRRGRAGDDDCCYNGSFSERPVFTERRVYSTMVANLCC